MSEKCKMCKWYNPFFGKCEGERFKNFDCDTFFRLGVKILEDLAREILKKREQSQKIVKTNT